MDPNAALARVRDAYARLNALFDHADRESLDTDQLEALWINACDLAESTEALDEWLAKGGFLPQDWTRA